MEASGAAQAKERTCGQQARSPNDGCGGLEVKCWDSLGGLR